MSYQYVIVTVCLSSRWVEDFLCQKVDAITLAKKLLDNSNFSQYGEFQAKFQVIKGLTLLDRL